MTKVFLEQALASPVLLKTYQVSEHRALTQHYYKAVLNGHKIYPCRRPAV